MCDANNHNSYGSVLTAVIEVHQREVYILDDIIVIFYRWLYDILCARGSMIQLSISKSISVNVASPVAATYCI